MRLSVLNVGKSQASQDKLVHSSLPRKCSGTRLTPTSLRLHTHSPKQLPKEERTQVQVGSYPKAEKPLLDACPGPPSPQGLQAGGNGHKEGLAQGPQTREVTSEQVLGSPHPQSQPESLPRGKVPASAHSPSWSLLSPLSQAEMMLFPIHPGTGEDLALLSPGCWLALPW